MHSNTITWFRYELVLLQCWVIDGQVVLELKIYKLYFPKELPNPSIKVEGNKIVTAKFIVDYEARTFTTKVINERK